MQVFRFRNPASDWRWCGAIQAERRNQNGWHRPLACAVGLPARRNGEGAEPRKQREKNTTAFLGPRRRSRQFAESHQVLLQIRLVVMQRDAPITEQGLKIEEISPGQVRRLHKRHASRGIKRDGQILDHLFFAQALKRSKIVGKSDCHVLKVATAGDG